MSKQNKNEDDGSLPVVDLQELLKSQQQVRANAMAAADEAAKQAAMDTYGLIEAGSVKKPTKKEQAELEELRSRVACLEAENMALSTENADLKSRLTPPPAPVAPTAPAAPVAPVAPANPFAAS